MSNPPEQLEFDFMNDIYKIRCQFCHTEEDPWFSRVEPMGYFCSKCGKSWEQHEDGKGLE